MPSSTTTNLVRRFTVNLATQTRPSRPMATSSRHVSMTGYLHPRASSSSPSTSTSSSSSPPATHRDLDVGELSGTEFKMAPLRRHGEDVATTRARLLYQSRKRGTLESDLVLATFAEKHLADMTPEQLAQYDAFLDENDWDIYYWATQDEATAASVDDSKPAQPSPQRAGEWANTVGTFKPAYRPVPERWRHSEVLANLRRHVKEHGMGKGGMAFMPSLG